MKPADLRLLPHQSHYCRSWQTMGVGVFPVIVIFNVIIAIIRVIFIVIIVIRVKTANFVVLLEMDYQVHESYAFVLQGLCFHLRCVLDLVEKLNWVKKR